MSAPLELQAGIDLGQFQRDLDALLRGGEDIGRRLNASLGGTTKKVILLETRVEADGSKRLVATERERLSVVDRIVAKQNELNKVEAGSLTSLRQRLNKAKQDRDQIAKYGRSVEDVSKRSRDIAPAWAAQNAEVGRLQRQVDLIGASSFWDKVKVGLNAQGLISFSNGLVQITQGLQAASILIGQITSSIGNLINAVAEVQQIQLTFGAIDQGAVGANTALQESSRIALGLGVSLTTVQEGFRQLTPVITNAGGSLGDVSNITEALSSRFAAFGLSGDKARRVMNGVIQAFSKGKLMAEELTQQISEADPAFKTDLAQAMGVSVARLEELVKAGKVTTDELIKQIPKLGKVDLLYGRLGSSAASAVAGLSQNNTALGRSVVTIDQVRNNFDTLNQLSLRRFALTSEPVAIAFLRLQAVFVDFFSRISSLDFSGIFTSLVDSLARVSTLFLAVAESALRIAEPILKLVSVFASIPGVTEAAGLALIGRFLRPLQDVQRAAIAAASTIPVIGGIIGATSAAGGELKKTEGIKAFDGAAKGAKGLRGLLGQISESGGVVKFGQEFERASKLVDNFSQNAGAVSKTSREIFTSLEKATLSVGVFRTEAGKPIGKGVSPEFVKGLRDLQQTNPEKALILAQAAVRGLMSEMANGEKVTKKYGESVGQAFKGDLKKQIQDIRGVITDIAGKRIAFDTKGLADASGDVNKLSSDIANLRAQSAKPIVITAQGPDSPIASGGASGSDKSSKQLSALAEAAADVSGSYEQADRSGRKLISTVSGTGSAAGSTGGRFRLLSSTFGALSGTIKGPLVGGLGMARGLFGSLATGARALVSALGPIGIALLAIGVATQAYSNATASANKIINDSKERVGALQSAIENLNTATKPEKLSGLGLASAFFSENVVKATDSLKQYLNQLTKTSGPVEALSLSYGTFATKFTLLSAIGRFLTNPIASITEFKEESSAAAIETARLGREVQALGNAAVAESAKLVQLIKAARDFAKNAPRNEKGELGAADLEKTVQSYNQIKSSLAQLEGRQKVAVNTAKELKNSASDYTTTYGAGLDKARKKLVELTQKGVRRGQALEDAAKSEGIDSEVLSQYDQLLQRLGLTEAAVKRVDSSVKQAKTSFDVYAKEQGYLTDEQAKTANTLKNLDEKTKEYTETLKSLTPELTSGKWQETNKLIARTSVEMDRLNDSAKTLQSLEIAKNINERIGMAELPNSLKNINTMISELGEAQIRVDVFSPQLPGILNDLIATKNYLEQLEGIKATIEISIVEKYIGAGGSGAATPGQLDRYLEALEKRRVSVPIGSSDADALIQTQERVKALVDAGSKSSAELRRSLLEEEYNMIQRKSEERQNADKQASDARRNALQSELEQVKEIAETRIEELRKLGPAEQALERIRVNKLLKQARKPGTKGLEARAELEKINRERQIAQIQEQTKQKERELQASIKAEEEAARKAEIKYREESLAIQRKQLELAIQEKEERMKAVKQILEQRNGQEGGTSADFYANMANAEIAAERAKVASENLAISPAASIADSMRSAADYSETFANNIKSLQGMQIQISVSGVPGRWAGGPVQGGGLYRVNELGGTEGFLSASGSLRPIQRPKNALWRAPSSGTVIPADIMATLGVPSAGVKIGQKDMPIPSSGGNTRGLVRALQIGMASRQSKPSGLQELAAVQAQQSIQLGKLGRAVDNLANKDWNVNVGLKVRDNAAYLNALNHRL